MMTNDDITWIVYAVDERSDNLKKSIIDSGATLFVSELNSNRDFTFPYEIINPWIVDKTKPYIIHGTKKLCQQANKLKILPGSLGFVPAVDYNHFTVHIPNEWLLNSNYYILPWGALDQRFNEITNLWGTGRISTFVRPITSMKSFTGFVLSNHSEYLKEGRLQNIQPEELIIVSSAKDVTHEMRFIIVDGEVVASSPYGWTDNEIYTTKQIDTLSEMARKVAALKWQPDIAYSCDIGLFGGRAKIVELNPFSSCGLYDCDTDAIVAAINRVTIKEFSY